MTAPSVQVLQGDCRDVLKTLPSESVHMVCTSPPYWNLRDYGVVTQVGLEQSPAAYVEALVGIFREIHRSTPGSAFTLALKGLGLPHMRLHDLRRTAIVWMREAGVELDVVQAIVGHKQLSTTVQIYGTVNRKRISEASRQMDSFTEVG